MIDRPGLVEHIIQCRLKGDEEFAKYAQKRYEDALRQVYPDLRADVAKAWRELKEKTDG